MIVRIIFCLLVWASTSQAQSTSFLWLPSAGSLPWTFSSTDVATVADRMFCIRIRTKVGITSATQLAFRTETPALGTNSVMGFAFYSNDGNTLIRSATRTETTWNTHTLYTITGLTAFSLASNTFYWYCWCNSGTTGDFTGIGEEQQGQIGDLLDTGATAAVVRFGRATNSCSTGVPPSSTGAMIDIDHGGTGLSYPPLILLGTATP